MKLRYYLTYSPENVTKPLLWELGHKFKLVTNIRLAEVKEQMGLVAVELDGESAEIEAGVQWLKSEGVRVEPIEQSVIEG